MTTPPHLPGRLSAFNIGLTYAPHLTGTGQPPDRTHQRIHSGHRRDRDRVEHRHRPGLPPHPDGTDVDRSRFTWPPWQGETIPDAHQKWKAVFATRDRTFRGIYYEGSTLEETPIIRVPATVLSDAMWKMVQKSPARSCAPASPETPPQPKSRPP
jgi:hypothetical protein